MIVDIYLSDNKALKSLGFELRQRVGNRLTYFLESSNLQVYVYIDYDIKTYTAQITKDFVVEAVIKPATTLEELINNIVEGNTRDYWWVDPDYGRKFIW